MRDTMRNLLAVAVAIGLLCVPAAVVRISYDIAFVGAGPAIEQLRSDIGNLSGESSEDVVGQATQWNQRIRSMQAYNAQWWGNPFIPDDWDRVEPLPVPKTKRAESASKTPATVTSLPRPDDGPV
ncbi:MAG: hypothetical protein JW809_08130 [Pirellulales bacterium]|nr:hypothetical protein [Pirellulales bacterium]